MVGRIGSGDPLKRRTPDENLVEHWPQLDIHAVAREGHLAKLMADRGMPTGQTGVAPLTIRIDSQEVRISWHNALSMPVWICPRCGARRYKLIRVRGTWGCRGCFGLRWRCRHRQASGGLGRLLRLRMRRRLSPLPRSGGLRCTRISGSNSSPRLVGSRRNSPSRRASRSSRCWRNDMSDMSDEDRE